MYGLNTDSNYFTNLPEPGATNKDRLLSEAFTQPASRLFLPTSPETPRPRYTPVANEKMIRTTTVSPFSSVTKCESVLPELFPQLKMSRQGHPEFLGWEDDKALKQKPTKQLTPPSLVDTPWSNLDFLGDCFAIADEAAAGSPNLQSRLVAASPGHVISVEPSKPKRPHTCLSEVDDNEYRTPNRSCTVTDSFRENRVTDQSLSKHQLAEQQHSKEQRIIQEAKSTQEPQQRRRESFSCLFKPSIW